MTLEQTADKIESERSKFSTITLKVAGEAGMGIFASGEMLAKAWARAGYDVFTYTEYPSLIRGGHNTYHIRIGDEPVRSQVQHVDILIALNEESIHLHLDEMTPQGMIIYDSTKVRKWKPEDSPRKDVRFLGIPMLDTALKAGGTKITKNVVAVGAVMALVGLPRDYLDAVIRHQFGKRPKIAEMNIHVAKAGYDYLIENIGEKLFKIQLKAGESKQKMLINCSDALSMGLIKGGLKAYFGYPMTPATPVLTFLTQHQKEFELVCFQVEDELAAINFAIGASVMGARAACGTSGGGFSLMTEAFGLAGSAEIPLVVVEAMRPGPSTGLPTWTGQGDLLFVAFASQGDFPRAILAPGDHEEHFELGFKALNLAEKYQMPVVILTDKWAVTSQATVPVFDTSNLKIERGKIITPENYKDILTEGVEFKRYEFTEDGISLRSIPGVPGATHRVSGNEHDEYGHINEDAENRRKMMDKRMKKLETLKNNKEDWPDPKIHGYPLEESDIAIISWGTTKQIILEAIARLEHRGIKASLIHVSHVWPFPTEFFESIKDKVKKTIVIENNYIGHFNKLLRQEALFDTDYQFFKDDGRPFFPEEITEKIEEIFSEQLSN